MYLHLEIYEPLVELLQQAGDGLELQMEPQHKQDLEQVGDAQAVKTPIHSFSAPMISNLACALLQMSFYLMNNGLGSYWCRRE